MDLAAALRQRLGPDRVREHEPIAPLTTLRVGGPADLFAVAHNAFELRALVRFARARELPHTILGPGFFMDNLIAPWTLPGLRDNNVFAKIIRGEIPAPRSVLRCPGDARL